MWHYDYKNGYCGDKFIISHHITYPLSTANVIFYLKFHKLSLLYVEKGGNKVMNDKLTTKEIFGIRLRDLCKQNGYTIE